MSTSFFRSIRTRLHGRRTGLALRAVGVTVVLALAGAQSANASPWPPALWSLLDLPGFLNW